MSLFSCLPESEINMVKRKLELAIYQAKQGYVDPGSFVIAVNAAMLELETWVEEHATCCVSLEGCGTCLDFDESKAFLESKGFFGQEVESYTDLEIPVGFRSSEHVVVHHDYSVVLKGAEIDVKGDLTQWSIDESKYFTPQKAEMRFLDGGMCDLDMATVEEDEIHAFTKIYAYLLAPGEGDKGKNAVLFTKVKQGKGLGSGGKIHLLDIQSTPKLMNWDLDNIGLGIHYFIGQCECVPNVLPTILTTPAISYDQYLNTDIMVLLAHGYNQFITYFHGKHPSKPGVDRVSEVFLKKVLPKWFDLLREGGHGPELTDPNSYTILVQGQDITQEALAREVSSNNAAAFFILHGLGHLTKKYEHVPGEWYKPGGGFMASGDGQDELMDGGHRNENGIFVPGPGKKVKIEGITYGIRLYNYVGLIKGDNSVEEANTEKERADLCEFLNQ